MRSVKDRSAGVEPLPFSVQCSAMLSALPSCLLVESWISLRQEYRSCTYLPVQGWSDAPGAGTSEIIWLFAAATMRGRETLMSAGVVNGHTNPAGNGSNKEVGLSELKSICISLKVLRVC